MKCVLHKLAFPLPSTRDTPTEVPGWSYNPQDSIMPSYMHFHSVARELQSSTATMPFIDLSVLQLAIWLILQFQLKLQCIEKGQKGLEKWGTITLMFMISTVKARGYIPINTVLSRIFLYSQSIQYWAGSFSVHKIQATRFERKREGTHAYELISSLQIIVICSSELLAERGTQTVEY